MAYTAIARVDLDQINDESVERLIRQIADHYKANIANRFIRPALLQLAFDDILWGRIETMTERNSQLDYQGYHIDDLYSQISALTKFVDAVRREIIPTLRYRIGNNYSDKTDKVLRDMAINNFSANIQTFAGLIYELYNKLVELDTAAVKKGKQPIYKQYAELSDIEEKLLNTGNSEQ
jgi:hypothetical protein